MIEGISQNGTIIHVDDSAKDAFVASLEVTRELLNSHFEDGSVEDDIIIFFTAKDQLFLVREKADFSPGKNVLLTRNKDSAEYQALLSGWLIMTKEGLLDIHPFLQCGPYNSSLFVTLLPASFGLPSMMSEYEYILDRARDYLNLSKEKAALLKERANEINPSNVKTILDKNEYLKKEIVSGMEPVLPQHAYIERKIKLKPKPPQGDLSDRVDHHEVSTFTEVDEGKLIAVKHKAKDGSPGTDIFGEEISVESAKDISFNAKDNIKIEEDDASIKYYAAKGGVLNLSAGAVAVSETLHVENAGPQTGNIKFSKDVIVSGSLLNGYRISCGGSLSIKGSVEDNCGINCSGELSIDGAVLGEHTRLVCSSNVRIKHVQDAYIRSAKDLIVEEYSYNARLHSAGRLEVRGEKVNSKSHGAVVGGICNALDYIFLKSAGSAHSKTSLSAGLDIELYTKSKELKQSLSALEKKIGALQNSIGLNLNSPAAKEKIKRMSPAERQRLKDKLSRVKELVLAREQLKKKKTAVSERVFSKEPDKVKIAVKEAFFGDVCVRIGELEREIKNESGGLVFIVENGMLSGSAFS